MNQIPKTDNKVKDASEHDITPQGIRDAGMLALLVILAMLTRGCGFFDGDKNITSKITNTTEIIRDSDDFTGRNVTIRSKVIRRVGISSFTVSDRQFFGGKPIVVLNASDVPFDLPSSQNIEVQVTGQVRNLDIKKIERDYKLNIQDKYYTDYINQPAIIARYIALAPKPGQVTKQPNQYYGRTVAVVGEVKNIKNRVLMNLDEDQLIGGEDLLVLFKQPPRVAINKGQTVAIMGKVRPFIVADIERDYKLDLDLNEKRELESEFNNTPVLIADNVYP